MNEKSEEMSQERELERRLDWYYNILDKLNREMLYITPIIDDLNFNLWKINLGLEELSGRNIEEDKEMIKKWLKEKGR